MLNIRVDGNKRSCLVYINVFEEKELLYSLEVGKISGNVMLAVSEKLGMNGERMWFWEDVICFCNLMPEIVQKAILQAFEEAGNGKHLL